MNKLQAYLHNNKISQANFALHLKVTRDAISKYLRGERFPRPEIILKIEKATDGYVRPSDWYVDNTAQPLRTDIVAQKDERKVNNDKEK